MLLTYVLISSEIADVLISLNLADHSDVAVCKMITSGKADIRRRPLIQLRDAKSFDCRLLKRLVFSILEALETSLCMFARVICRMSNISGSRV